MSFEELFPLSENQFISNIIKCEYKGLVFVNICFNLNEPYILSRLTLIIDSSGVLVDAFQSYYFSDTKSWTSTEQFITHAMVDNDELMLQLVNPNYLWVFVMKRQNVNRIWEHRNFYQKKV